MAQAPSIPDIHAAISKDPRWALVQRVVSSRHFSTSSRLREFLLYVGQSAILGSPEDVTEQQIGIHVFHRPPGYNSNEDSIVRTHARLLRQKLGEYFTGEGAAEEVIIEIPKGHYLPVFQPAAPHPLETSHEETSQAPAAALTHSWARGRPGKIWLAIAGCLLVLLFASTVWWSQSESRAAASGMKTLWGPFLSGSPPLVIYSNALFVRDSDNGFHVAPPETETSPSQPLRESGSLLYTGTGAVVAVRQLTQLFDAHHATFILKRSLLVTWDDARSQNLIFIGSRAQNPALNMLPSMNDFSLIAEQGHPTGFTNNHPKPGEPDIYSRPDYFFSKDYAVLALLPGLQRGKWILIFSGLSTLGTEAAVEYASRPEDVAALLRAASFKSGEIRPFEALLETAIVGGVPTKTRLVTIHTH